jgi:hypothetical protein
MSQAIFSGPSASSTSSGDVLLSVLLELLEEVAQTAAQDPSGRTAPEQAAEQPAKSAAWPAGIAGRGIGVGRAACRAAEHVRQPAFALKGPVSQQAEQRHRDRRHAAAAASAENIIEQTHFFLRCTGEPTAGAVEKLHGGRRAPAHGFVAPVQS